MCSSSVPHSYDSTHASCHHRPQPLQLQPKQEALDPSQHPHPPRISRNMKTSVIPYFQSGTLRAQRQPSSSLKRQQQAWPSSKGPFPAPYIRLIWLC